MSRCRHPVGVPGDETFKEHLHHRHKDKSQGEMEKEAHLRGKLEGICLEYPRYGYRRVTEQLKREGLRVNHKKVLQLMRESDLLCRVRRRRVKTH